MKQGSQCLFCISARTLCSCVIMNGVFVGGYDKIGILRKKRIANASIHLINNKTLILHGVSNYLSTSALRLQTHVTCSKQLITFGI